MVTNNVNNETCQFAAKSWNHDLGNKVHTISDTETTINDTTLHVIAQDHAMTITK